MPVLYAISIVSFVVLLGACLAIVRYVRTGRHSAEQQPGPPEPSFAEHLRAAMVYGSVREPRQVHQQTVKAIIAKQRWNVAPSQVMEIHPAANEATAGYRRSGSRRAELHGTRSDWEHFNKDYGHLSDPHPSRPVRTTSRER